MNDWRGTPLKIGSTVVYPSRQSSRLWMNEGTVVEIDLSRTLVRVGVCKKGGTRVSYPHLQRLTVV